MKLALILAAVIACDPHGVAASRTPYADDVERVRIEWSLDATLPLDVCDEPDIAIARVDAPYYLAGTLVIAEGLDEPARHVAVMHETAHWLSDCTGHEDTSTGDGWAWAGADRWHRDPRLWWVGVLGRAELAQ